MTDKNIRFREALPPRPRKLDLWELPGSVFEYGGIVFGMILDSEEREPPYLCCWIQSGLGGHYYRLPAWRSLGPEVHRAARVWAQDGYGEMSLAEFLNVTVPQ